MTESATKPSDAEKTPDQDMVITYLTMRRALGTIGFLLPVAILIGGYFTDRCLRTSISAYYYSDNPIVHGIFVGTLCAMGFFLIAYKGHKPEPGEILSDNLVSAIAGAGAIGVAIFPTEEAGFRVFNESAAVACERLSIEPQFIDELFSSLHFFSAGVLFGAVALLCIRFFTRNTPIYERRPGQSEPVMVGRVPVKRGSEKHRRNVVYRICGWAILACIVLIGIEAIFIDPETRQDWAPDIGAIWPFGWLPSPVFWFEAIAVWALAAAWLVKGQAIEAMLGAISGSNGSGKSGNSPQ